MPLGPIYYLLFGHLFAIHARDFCFDMNSYVLYIKYSLPLFITRRSLCFSVLISCAARYIWIIPY